LLSLILAGLSCGNDPDGIASEGEDHGDHLISEGANGNFACFDSAARWQDQVVSHEDFGSIMEVYSVLLDIGQAFAVVPCEVLVFHTISFGLMPVGA